MQLYCVVSFNSECYLTNPGLWCFSDFCQFDELEDDSKWACDKEMLWQKAWHTYSGFIPSCALFSVMTPLIDAVTGDSCTSQMGVKRQRDRERERSVAAVFPKHEKWDWVHLNHIIPLPKCFVDSHSSFCISLPLSVTPVSSLHLSSCSTLLLHQNTIC